MFEDSLLDAKIKTRRKSATVVSFILQAILIGIIVLIPLMFTEALPLKQITQTMLVAPPPPPPPPPPPSSTPRVVKPVTSEIETTGELRTPTTIPKTVAMIKESAAPPPATAGVVGGVPGGVPGGQIGGIIGGVMGAVPTVAPKLAAPQRVRVSQGVTEGLLVHKVVPEYPPLAKAAHITGTVVLQAVIGKDGTIQNLQVVSGHPMLTAAAISAVKQWKYKPYVLNGQATEVETSITVNFKMAG